MQRGGASGVALAESVAGRLAVFCQLLAVLAALTAVVIAGRSLVGVPGRRLRAAMAPLLVVVFVAGGASLAVGPLFDPIRADSLTKQATVGLEAGEADGALFLLARARLLAPREPAVLTATARASVVRMALGGDLDVRRLMLAAGTAAVERATLLEPLDPDHRANHARVLVSAVETGAWPEARPGMLEESAALYRAGLELRPQSLLFRVELAGTLLRLRESSAARSELRRVIQADPAFEVPALMLASMEQKVAVDAALSGDGPEGARRLELALSVLSGLRRHRPDHWASRRVLSALCARSGRDEGTAAYGALLEPGGEAMHRHEMLALLDTDCGDDGSASVHARRAVELAPAALRARASAGRELLERRLERRPPRQEAGPEPE